MTDATPQAITKWVLLFSGFRQDSSQYSGTNTAWRILHEQCAGPQSVVEYHPWNTDARALALKVMNNRNGASPDIVLGGYSFGGQTAVNVAKQLKLCGLPVRKMVLTDPVYRESYYVGWWRSMLPWSKIEVPFNVHEVTYFVQRNNRYWPPNRQDGWLQPAGHRLVAEDPEATTINDPIVLANSHATMDDAPEYRVALEGACQCSA